MLTYLQLIRRLEIPLSFRRELLKLLRLSVPEACVQLQEYAGCILKFRKQHHAKSENYATRRILWGREYDAFLQKRRAEGLCDKTAKTAAHRDFRKAHSYSDSGAKNLPGHSGSSIRRYHRAFLNCKKS